MALMSLESLSKIFVMGGEPIHALSNVNISIQKGEFLAIIGPSGSGKSTFMNILGLLDRPTSGRYFLEDRDVSQLPDRELAQLRNQKIGFVFQSFNLLPRASALRNVEMPLVYSATYDPHYHRSKTKAKALEALAKVSLGDRTGHRPNELSGGQRQRVAIARAIVNSPKIIFADEPTGNLDSKSGNDILNIFKELHHDGVTLILVTHDPQIASHAKRVLNFFDGKIVKDTYAPE